MWTCKANVGSRVARVSHRLSDQLIAAGGGHLRLGAERQRMGARRGGREAHLPEQRG